MMNKRRKQPVFSGSLFSGAMLKLKNMLSEWLFSTKKQKYFFIKVIYKSCKFSLESNAAVAQSVRAFASHAECWVFESHPRQTYVVNTGIDSSTAKRSATGASVTGLDFCIVTYLINGKYTVHENLFLTRTSFWLTVPVTLPSTWLFGYRSVELMK